LLVERGQLADVAFADHAQEEKQGEVDYGDTKD